MQVGIKVVHRQLPDTVSQADMESVVKATCDDQSIDGILVQVKKLVCFKRPGVCQACCTAGYSTCDCSCRFQNIWMTKQSFMQLTRKKM